MTRSAPQCYVALIIPQQRSSAHARPDSGARLPELDFRGSHKTTLDIRRILERCPCNLSSLPTMLWRDMTSGPRVLPAPQEELPGQAAGFTSTHLGI